MVVMNQLDLKKRENLMNKLIDEINKKIKIKNLFFIFKKIFRLCVQIY
jgi:hypothetical protein